MAVWTFGLPASLRGHCCVGYVDVLPLNSLGCTEFQNHHALKIINGGLQSVKELTRLFFPVQTSCSSW